MLSFRISPILSIPVAPAPPKNKKASPIQRAIKHYEKGIFYFKRGKLEDALIEFKKSYELSKNYDALYNVGRCLSELSRLNEAIEIYEQFLQERLKLPDSQAELEEVKRVRAEIARFKKIEADIEAKIREAELKDKPVPPPKPSTPKPEPKKGLVEKPLATPKPHLVPPPYRKWATWTAFGFAAASAAAGLASFVKADERAETHGNLTEDWKASGKINCEAGVCRAVDKADADKLQGLENDVDKYNRFGVIALSTAAASLALGVGLLLFGKPQQKPKVSLAPAIGDQLGLGLSIEF